MQTGKTVYVGLSGGVDSSVAALRLKQAGYTVIGVFIKVWHPDFMVCNWEAERLDAMRVAAHLDIPFLTCDAVDAYRDEVAHYFISEYQAGRTPNPDVLCNKEVKFGAFLRFAKEQGADYIATGHYVERNDDTTGAKLHRGKDNNKDQSYFLWSLSQEQLDYSLFPVGDTPKEQIRKVAAKAGIPTAAKKDSQGICFLGHVDIAEFLSHYTTLREGTVLNEQGDTIGTHKGALIYTLGQRHGFTLSSLDSDRPNYFVIGKDMAANTITVAPQRALVTSDEIIILRNTVLRSPLKAGDVLEAQFRYRQSPFQITIEAIDTDGIRLITATDIERPAVGQSCVLYRGSHCIGGGMIAE